MHEEKSVFPTVEYVNFNQLIDRSHQCMMQNVNAFHPLGQLFDNKLIIPKSRDQFQ